MRWGQLSGEMGADTIRMQLLEHYQTGAETYPPDGSKDRLAVKAREAPATEVSRRC